MSTRLYFPSSGDPPQELMPAYGGFLSWTFPSWPTNTLTYSGSIVRGSTPMVATMWYSTSSTNPVLRGVMRYIYGPLAAQAISGTVKAQLKCAENVGTANSTFAAAIKIVTSAGHDRAVLLSPVGSDDTSTTPPEMAVTTLTNRTLLDAAETTPLTLSAGDAVQGDYLVVELGHRSATSTARTVQFQIGEDSATALGENNTDTADYYPWIEFSADLVFGEGNPPVFSWVDVADYVDQEVNAADFPGGVARVSCAIWSREPGTTMKARLVSLVESGSPEDWAVDAALGESAEVTSGTPSDASFAVTLSGVRRVRAQVGSITPSTDLFYIGAGVVR